ncbi:hypothetical protein ID866_3168 [Astraeus odoratus]|nr:hypothetical protein ID866_3168 [Astraeus odoratus]
MYISQYSPKISSSLPGTFYAAPPYAKMEIVSESSLNAWSTSSYLPRPSSKARPAATVNPRAIIPPYQTSLSSDVETPSSASSHSVLTPLSPFTHLDLGAPAPQEDPEIDDFEYEDDDEDDECIDSDFPEDVEMSEEGPSQMPLNGQSEPHVIKSAALDDQLEAIASFDAIHRGDYHSPARIISDRKMSASAPGCGSTSHHFLPADAEQLQRWFQREQPSSSDPDGSFPDSSMLCPSHMYGHIGFSSSPTSAVSTPPAALHQQHSYSFPGAITCTNTYNASEPIPIMQPQPIRPIPPIPLDDFTSGAMDSSSSYSCGEALSPQRLKILSPLPLLCQPVSDAVRYQFQGSSADQTSSDPECYEDEDTSEGVCENDIVAGEAESFPYEGLHSAQDHRLSAVGTCSTEGLISSYGYGGMTIRWQ